MKGSKEDHTGMNMLSHYGRCVRWYMDHVWQVWNMLWVMASPPTTHRQAQISSWFWIELQNCTSARWQSCPRRITWVWICYPTGPVLLCDTIWSMSDRCVTCHELWLHLQSHHIHVQLSSNWFSNIAWRLHLQRVVKCSKKNHTGKNMLPHYDRIIGWYMDYIRHVSKLSMVLASPQTTTQTFSAMTTLVFYQASILHPHQSNEDCVGLDMLLQ